MIMNYITYDDFKKLDMRVGTIKHVVPVEGADKLLVCQIDFGPELATPLEITDAENFDANGDGIVEENILSIAEESKIDAAVAENNQTEHSSTRQIVSGIREYYPDYEKLVGKQVLYVVNLEPRTIRGHISHGMLMAVGNDKPVFLIPEESVDPGSQVR
jgi:methionyl-tRNA synthetase